LHRPERNLLGNYGWFWEGEKIYAVVGVSRKKKKFGNALFKELKTRGKRVYAVGSGPAEIDGGRIYESLSSLPEKPDAIVISVKPGSAKKVVQDCVDLGIGEVWFQQGSFVPELAELCKQNGLRFIPGSCPLLYLTPVRFPHNLHVWLVKLFGKY